MLVRGHVDYDFSISIFFHIKNTQSTLLIPYDDTVLEHSLSNIELSAKKSKQKASSIPQKSMDSKKKHQIQRPGEKGFPSKFHSSHKGIKNPSLS